MNKQEKHHHLIPISEYFKLSVLELLKIAPVKTEYQSDKFWAYFDRDSVEPIISAYESGTLKVSAIEFVSAIRRVKDRIFETQRAYRKGVVNYEQQYTSINKPRQS